MLGFGGINCPSGVGAVVSLIVNVKLPLLHAPRLSHVCKFTTNTPLTVGVKLIMPVALSIVKPLNGGVTLTKPNVTVSFVGSESVAFTSNMNGIPASADLLDKLTNAGASLTFVIITVMFCDTFLPVPSKRNKVMSRLPDWFTFGVTVSMSVKVVIVALNNDVLNDVLGVPFVSFARRIFQVRLLPFASGPSSGSFSYGVKSRLFGISS